MRGKRIPFVPSPMPVVRRMVELAEPKEGEIFCDLGSGDGRFLAEAAGYGCACVGVEVNPKLVEVSRRKLSGVPNARVIRSDLFRWDLSQVDVLVLYLTKDALARLAPKMARMKPGARILSHDFRIPGLRPIYVEEVWHKRPHYIYLYRIPESLGPLRPGRLSSRKLPQGGPFS